MNANDEFNVEMLDLAQKAIDRTRPMSMTQGERNELDAIANKIAKLTKSLKCDISREKL